MSKKNDIFESCLTKEFNNEGFTIFVKELLNNANMVAPDIEKEVRNNFSYYVSKYCHIANYEDEDNNNIAIFSVALRKGETVERARSMQRNFVKKLIEDTSNSGALVAFYTPEEPSKWRLSLIRLDYEFCKGTITEKITPARRYSYLVGNGEPCHTALKRLLPIFLDDIKNPSLDDLEEAFSVESVTKEFFELYRKKYLDLKEYLDNHEVFVREANMHNFTSEQFAKKLMGQIVFLYFIQKKGWLGVDVFKPNISNREYKDAYYYYKGANKEVSRKILEELYKQQADGTYRIDIHKLQNLSDEEEELIAKCFKGAEWGTGPKDFMRKIFDGCVRKGQNFFDDYLEPLFYTGLNMNRGENSFYAPLHRRVPFLNGGLFQPIDKYDWENNYFGIPNDIFSNIDEKDREADGILDIFDRYNFTMNEDEPLEKEVAIDPEMLGKVFENLLDVTDRKSKGAFYTPRDIVHYMCQESLVNYLANQTSISETAIRDLVLYIEFMRDEDTKKDKWSKEQNKYIYDYDKELLISNEILDFKNNINRLEDIDNALKNVTVADPAVGSGAFVLGMLNEIVKIRSVLTDYMAIGMSYSEKESFITNGRTLYQLKTRTIKNSIFACDLEPSAVDIAKLRLWLSIVIDDEISLEDDEFRGKTTKPKPLPNLNCNIICGNSLVTRFKNLPLIDKSELLNNLEKETQLNFASDNVHKLIEDLIQLQDKLFFVRDHNDRDDIERGIQDIYNEIILEQIKTNSNTVNAYYEAIEEASKPFILWPLHFPNVFRNGGFDIVIGNPPYIQLQKAISDDGTKLGDLYKDEEFKTFARTGDIYCLFYEKGFELLKDGGVLAYITSNKWMRAGYGKALRGFLAKNTNPKLVIDFAGQKVFDSATVDVNILLYTKEENREATNACIINEDCKNNLSVFIQQNSSIIKYTTDDSWIILSPIEQSIKRKIEAVGVPLKEWNIDINYGIKTGYNEAFIISGETKDQLIAEDPKSAEIIRPILRGRDVGRYTYNFADLWLIYVPWHFPLHKENIQGISIKAENLFENQYPAVYKHLLKYKDKLSTRNKAETGIRYEWYALQRWGAKYSDDFSKPKIIYPCIMANNSQFIFDAQAEYFTIAPGNIITGENLKYLLETHNFIGVYHTS